METKVQLTIAIGPDGSSAGSCVGGCGVGHAFAEALVVDDVGFIGPDGGVAVPCGVEFAEGGEVAVDVVAVRPRAPG